MAQLHSHRDALSDSEGANHHPIARAIGWLRDALRMLHCAIGAAKLRRLQDLQRPYGLLAKLEKGIEFDAFDGQAVDVLFVLLLPAAVENEALGALALVARTLRPSDILARLRAAKNPAELYAAMA